MEKPKNKKQFTKIPPEMIGKLALHYAVEYISYFKTDDIARELLADKYLMMPIVLEKDVEKSEKSRKIFENMDVADRLIIMIIANGGVKLMESFAEKDKFSARLMKAEYEWLVRKPERDLKNLVKGIVREKPCTSDELYQKYASLNKHSSKQFFENVLQSMMETDRTVRLDNKNRLVPVVREIKVEYPVYKKEHSRAM